MTTVVYTDGACKGNPGPGGWGWVVPDGPWANGNERQSTNQRMEVMAALDALRSLSGEVQVVSDSTYVVNCFRDGWWEGWLRRNWTNSAKKPVANRDLWEPLIELYQSRSDEISFKWVKGHAGDRYNDIADRLAVEAAAFQHSRRGVGLPDDLGEPDSMGASEATEKRASGSMSNSSWRPSGRAVAVLGLQPPELGGYDENRIAARVRAQLTEILAAQRTLHDDLVVLTGLRLGAETLGAEAAMKAGVPFVAVLPYPDPDSRWSASARAKFKSLCDAAEAVVELEHKPPRSSRDAGSALDRRNGWLRQVADEAVIVWDGHEPRVRVLVNDFEQRFPDDVWVVQP